MGDILVLINMWWHRVGFPQDELPPYRDAALGVGVQISCSTRAPHVRGAKELARDGRDLHRVELG